MAVYKVPQDVEAEDKLIGPFTFRQFVFLLLMCGFLYFAYFLFNIAIFLAFIPLPFAAFFALLAFPWRKDQPTEVYLTALIHFWLKPRRRIWDKDGLSEHVHIDVPKVVEHKYTDGLSGTEVRSRLHNLAQTLDSRGWSSKNLSLEDTSTPMQPAADITSDRIAMPQAPAPQANPAMRVSVQDDVLDAQNNPVAQNFDDMVQKQTQDHLAQVTQQTQAAARSQPDDGVAYDPYPQMQQAVVQPVSQQPTPQAQPSQPQAPPQPPQPQEQPMNPEAKNAILSLANNSDLNVSTIARQADEAMQSGDTIELH